MSVGQDSRHNLSASGSVFSEAYNQAIDSRLHSACQAQLRLKNLPLSSLLWLLPDLRFLLWWLSPWAIWVSSRHGSWWSEKGKLPQDKSQGHFIAIVKMTFHYFCHILCVRIKSTNKSSSHTGMSTGEVMGHLSNCPPQSSFQTQMNFTYILTW